MNANLFQVVAILFISNTALGQEALTKPGGYYTQTEALIAYQASSSSSPRYYRIDADWVVKCESVPFLNSKTCGRRMRDSENSVSEINGKYYYCKQGHCTEAISFQPGVDNPDVPSTVDGKNYESCKADSEKKQAEIKRLNALVKYLRDALVMCNPEGGNKMVAESARKSIDQLEKLTEALKSQKKPDAIAPGK